MAKNPSGVQKIEPFFTSEISFDRKEYLGVHKPSNSTIEFAYGKSFKPLNLLEAPKAPKDETSFKEQDKGQAEVISRFPHKSPEKVEKKKKEKAIIASPEKSGKFTEILENALNILARIKSSKLPCADKAKELLRIIKRIEIDVRLYRATRITSSKWDDLVEKDVSADNLLDQSMPEYSSFKSQLDSFRKEEMSSGSILGSMEMDTGDLFQDIVTEDQMEAERQKRKQTAFQDIIDGELSELGDESSPELVSTGHLSIKEIIDSIVSDIEQEYFPELSGLSGIRPLPTTKERPKRIEKDQNQIRAIYRERLKRSLQIAEGLTGIEDESSPELVSDSFDVLSDSQIRATNQEKMKRSLQQIAEGLTGIEDESSPELVSDSFDHSKGERSILDSREMDTSDFLKDVLTDSQIRAIQREKLKQSLQIAEGLTGIEDESSPELVSDSFDRSMSRETSKDMSILDSKEMDTSDFLKDVLTDSQIRAIQREKLIQSLQIAEGLTGIEDESSPELFTDSFDRSMSRETSKDMSILDSKEMDTSDFLKDVLTDSQIRAIQREKLKQSLQIAEGLTGIEDESSPELVSDSFDRSVSRETSKDMSILDSREMETSDFLKDVLTDSQIRAIQREKLIQSLQIAEGLTGIEDESSPELVSDSFDRSISRKETSKDMSILDSREMDVSDFLKDVLTDSQIRAIQREKLKQSLQIAEGLTGIEDESSPELVSDSFDRSMSRETSKDMSILDSREMDTSDFLKDVLTDSQIRAIQREKLIQSLQIAEGLTGIEDESSPELVSDSFDRSISRKETSKDMSILDSREMDVSDFLKDVLTDSQIRAIQREKLKQSLQIAEGLTGIEDESSPELVSDSFDRSISRKETSKDLSILDSREMDTSNFLKDVLTDSQIRAINLEKIKRSLEIAEGLTGIEDESSPELVTDSFDRSMSRETSQDMSILDSKEMDVSDFLKDVLTDSQIRAINLEKIKRSLEIAEGLTGIEDESSPELVTDSFDRSISGKETSQDMSILDSKEMDVSDFLKDILTDSQIRAINLEKIKRSLEIAEGLTGIEDESSPELVSDSFDRSKGDRSILDSREMNTSDFLKDILSDSQIRAINQDKLKRTLQVAEGLREIGDESAPELVTDTSGQDGSRIEDELMPHMSFSEIFQSSIKKSSQQEDIFTSSRKEHRKIEDESMPKFTSSSNLSILDSKEMDTEGLFEDELISSLEKILLQPRKPAKQISKLPQRPQRSKIPGSSRIPGPSRIAGPSRIPSQSRTTGKEHIDRDKEALLKVVHLQSEELEKTRRRYHDFIHKVQDLLVASPDKNLPREDIRKIFHTLKEEVQSFVGKN
ncbi:hypothetical protein DMENIID0001_133820 [Sergentomyia squamirostris]